MKKLIIALFSLLALVATPSLATAAPCNGYMPKQGDNLWDLSRKHLGDPRLYKYVVENENPSINWSARTHTDAQGRTIVWVYPSDCLAGLTREGGLNRAWVVGRWSTSPTVSATPDHTGNVGTSGTSPSTSDDTPFPWWVLWVIIIVVLLIAALVEGARREDAEETLAENEELNRDPVTSGPAIVPDGVNDATMARARFAEAAARTSSISAVRLDITDMVAGRIWGTLDVHYGDGTWAARRHHGERAWQANVRFPHGRTEVMYMLQACGNDLRFGGMTEHAPGADFRFEPDAPAQAPARAAAPVAQAPAAAEDGAEPNLDGVDIFIQLQEPTANKPARLLYKGVKNVTFEGRRNGVSSIRFEAE